MSYDPREGSSPYLGMDPDTIETSDAAAGKPSDARRGVEAPVRTGARAAAQDASRDVPPTMLRPSQAPQRGVAPTPNETVASARPLRRTYQHDARAVPSPPQQAYEPARAGSPRVNTRMAGPLARFESALLVLVAWAFRLAAIALVILFVLSAVLTGSHRAQLVSMLNVAPLLVPPVLLGHFVQDTPFGGVLRGDMAIASVALFIADWLCMKVAASLRARTRKGA